MHHAFFLIALFAHCVAPHPGIYQARAEESCTAVETVTATTTASATVTVISIPPAITITATAFVSILITTTNTAPTTSPTSSTATISSPLPSGTCINAPYTLPDGGFEDQLPWLGQPLTSIKPLWIFNNQHSGTRALQLSVSTRGASGQFELWQWIHACAGQSYKFVAWAKTSDVSTGCQITWIMNDLVLVVQTFATTGYEMATATWVAPVPLDDLLILKISLQCNSSAPAPKIVYLDDVSLQPLAL